MSILDHIENLRQRPEDYRRRVAFLLTLSITLIIFVGWGFSLWLSVNDYRTPETVTSGLAEVKNTTSEGVERIFLGVQVVKSQIGDIIQMISSND